MVKMAINGVKRHKKSENEESRAVKWGGEKGCSPKLPLGSLRSPTFFGSFTTTAELGPRLECLDESHKNVIYIVLISQITAHVVKRVTTMFILVFLINITSTLAAIRINTISVSAYLTKVELFRYKAS